ncbi:unnamed protein product, partial [Laminaria digitata]
LCVSPCHRPVDQCGGAEWAGSTCCSEDNECTVMGDGCYSQVRET